jgi:hypothetical protein
MNTDIPPARRPEDLTTAWAQSIVNRHVPGVVVSGVEILSVNIGTTTRVRLEIGHDGPEDLPRRWFVKLPSSSWRARLITALPRLLETEARFYREVSSVVPVAHPAVLAAQSARRRGVMLALADVTETGAVTGNAGDVLSAAQAALVIEQLAGLHAHFCAGDMIDRQYRWLDGPVRRLENRLGSALAAPLMRRGLGRAGDNVPAVLRGPAMEYARKRKAVMALLSDGPRTLVHHDPHPGNLYWLEGRPGLLDWQLVRVGEGIGDVAYLMATSLAPETRRLHEDGLLEGYLHALQGRGVTAYDLSALRGRYRIHLLYALEAMIVTLAVGGMMELEYNLELVRRAAAAVEDNGSFEAEPLREILR